MDSLPTLDLPETAEPGPPGAPPCYRDAQVWKDLEAETGFASCADYLEYYEDVRPDFRDRLMQLQDMPETLPTRILIYDLSTQEDLPISLSLRRHCHSGTELIQALREPPGNVGVQLVIWSFKPGSLNQEMADALILGLKLDPRLSRRLYSNVLYSSQKGFPCFSNHKSSRGRYHYYTITKLHPQRSDRGACVASSI